MQRGCSRPCSPAGAPARPVGLSPEESGMKKKNKKKYWLSSLFRSSSICQHNSGFHLSRFWRTRRCWERALQEHGLSGVPMWGTGSARGRLASGAHRASGVGYRGCAVPLLPPTPQEGQGGYFLCAWLFSRLTSV